VPLSCTVAAQAGVAMAAIVAVAKINVASVGIAIPHRERH
jgi:hypothetical protein